MPFLLSCEDKANLNVTEGPKRLVVEGGISNDPGPYQVKLTITQAINTTAPEAFVDGAIVVIIEDFTVRDTLQNLGSGNYQTNTISQGSIGSTYQLYIKTPEGLEYESIEETMQDVPGMDSLFFKEKDDITPNFFLTDGAIYGFTSFRDPSGIDNYYRYKFFLNGVYQGTSSDIFVVDDSFNDGQYIEERFDYELAIGDTLKVTQIAVSQRRSNFLVEWSTLLNANGGPFDPPLSPLIGNIYKKGSTSEYANGYFYAISEFTTERLVE